MSVKSRMVVLKRAHIRWHHTKSVHPPVDSDHRFLEKRFVARDAAVAEWRQIKRLETAIDEQFTQAATDRR
ncbi:hypothetical protein D3C86_2039710 [compost metagenome]